MGISTLEMNENSSNGGRRCRFLSRSPLFPPAARLSDASFAPGLRGWLPLFCSSSLARAGSLSCGRSVPDHHLGPATSFWWVCPRTPRSRLTASHCRQLLRFCRFQPASTSSLSMASASWTEPTRSCSSRPDHDAGPGPLAPPSVHRPAPSDLPGRRDRGRLLSCRPANRAGRGTAAR